jgi:hypothetical protein
MVKIEDVPRWVIMRGIGHAVRQMNGWGAHTACDHLIYGKLQAHTPKRICRKCRKRLKEARLFEG